MNNELRRHMRQEILDEILLPPHHKIVLFGRVKPGDRYYWPEKKEFGGLYQKGNDPLVVNYYAVARPVAYRNNIKMAMPVMLPEHVAQVTLPNN